MSSGPLSVEEIRELAALLRDRSLRVSKERPFKLASGRESPYFLDLKPVAMSARGGALIARGLLGMVRDHDVLCVGGMESGAIPLVAMVVLESARSGGPLEGFYVRKQPKGHGTNALIEGNLRPGPVAILEDVVTTGGSALKAAKAAVDGGAEVRAVLAAVDRGEGGAEELRAKGLDFAALLTLRDIVDHRGGGASST
jgi:orotate phosphoribosyltransferase